MSFLLFNVGVPMIFPSLIMMIIALVPIIILEGGYLSFSLNISLAEAFKNSATANILSTFIGIPVAWILLVIISLVTGGGGWVYPLKSPFRKLLAVIVHSPWIPPSGRNTRWMIPAAGLVLLIPFFFASWFTEYRIESHLLENVELSAAKQAIRSANLLSYALLAGYLLYKLRKEQLRLLRAVLYKSLAVRRKQRLKTPRLSTYKVE